jgi:outer membrane receptor protein involved in Fe transport
MKIRSIISLLAFLLIISPLVFSQSRETGAIVGTVIDDEGTPLPGVTVTLTSPAIMGEKSLITDAEGSYRFPALRPGQYAVKAELPGFATVIQEGIRLHTTIRLTVDMTLRVSTIEEEVTVIAVSPTVDIKTSETASVTLSDELLRAMPTSQFVTGIVNLAPGVTDNVAYGGSSSSVSYQVDGVDVSDPEGGTAWVFLDYNIIEEAKIMGIGLNAEYGAFTGIIFNTITKSGGNEFSGHAEIIFQDTKKNNFWTTDNNQAYIDENPSLTSPLQGLWDSSVHIGGPIKKDKHWFFLGLQYYRSKARPTGLEAPHFRDYKQPRFFLKLTSQLSSKVNLTGWFELDQYNGINRGTGVTHPVPETGVKQTSPEWVVNLDLTTVLNPTTFFNLKGAYFWGYYYLDPQGEGAALYSWEDNRWYNNSEWHYKADRTRFQANASISNYAEDFIAGDHDFKFGTEFERGWARSRYGFTGNIEGIGNAAYISDYFGYLYAYQYEGYDTDTSYIRNEWFLQDAWSISDNVTLNLGLRYSINRGFVKGKSGAQYSTNRIAPRVGFAWDIFGDHTTVLKAHWGEYTEAMFTGFLDRMNPIEAYSDFVAYYWDDEWIEWGRWPATGTTFADSYSHPYMVQWTVGIERELFKDTSLGITYINRNWKNILNTYDLAVQFEEITVYDPYNDNPYTVYNQLNVGARERVIGNIQKGDPWILEDVYRQYHGVEVLFNKRFSDRWQLLASYVWSKTTGTISTGWGDDFGYGGATWNPNFWIYRDGNVAVDPTHMVKLQGSYILPLDIHFNAYFAYRTGNAYTRRARFRLDQGRETIHTEPMGSRRYESRTNLDLRIEKTFMIAEKYRIGLMIDIFNVFNADTITNWGSRTEYDWYEDLSEYPASDGHQVYGLVNPRAIRLGVRFFF